jgi:putative cell wall-binding protein
VTIGSTFSRSGSFADPDDESWTATVDYGDGAGPIPLTLNSNKIFSLSHLYGETGAYTVTVTVEDSGDLRGSDTFVVTVNAPSPAYVRYIGTDRYDTALQISRAAYPNALPSGSGLVLAPGETFQEALCGAPLAAAYGGPVLLTPTSGLNNAVRAEIIRLAPQTVVCIGLSDAIRDGVQAALGPNALVTAIRGKLGSVYDMSYKVALALEDRVGDMSDATAIITRGDMFPDAIGVSPLACATKWPILLTNAVSGNLNASAVAALYDLNITTVLKVGTYAVPPAGVTGLANLSGSDRYYTNANVAEWGATNGYLSFGHVGIATGDKFPDALASGPYLALDGGILLLSPLYGPLPPCIAAEIDANASDVHKVTFIAMIEPVISQVKVVLP